MSEEIKTEYYRTVFITSRKCRNFKEGTFIAWMGLQPPTANNPIEDENEPIYFNFGKTQNEAIEKIKGQYEKFIHEVMPTP
jgi:hypothetical protein